MQLLRRDVLKGLASLPVMSVTGPTVSAATTGEFKGMVVTRWSDDGRAMILIEPFEYIDPEGKRWPVPPGTSVDGASIPRFFWTVIGGPFEGKYRNASVVHDFYCQVRTRPFRDVHKVFHDAMVTSGLTDRTSWLMFQAVNNFGPQWADPKVDPKCEVVDDNYDFIACAKNSAAPEKKLPAAGRGELEEFLAEVEAKADPQDISKLRASLKDAQ